MTTGGITRIEMETMSSIKSACREICDIKELLAGLIDVEERKLSALKEQNALLADILERNGN